jgi:hypothetical protein
LHTPQISKADLECSENRRQAIEAAAQVTFTDLEWQEVRKCYELLLHDDVGHINTLSNDEFRRIRKTGLHLAELMQELDNWPLKLVAKFAVLRGKELEHLPDPVDGLKQNGLAMMHGLMTVLSNLEPSKRGKRHADIVVTLVKTLALLYRQAKNRLPKKRQRSASFKQFYHAIYCTIPGHRRRHLPTPEAAAKLIQRRST